MRLNKHDALIVVDMQLDFCPGGALAVPDGGAVVPVVNRLSAAVTIVVATQDWHPPGHSSFASSHPGRAPFETVRLSYGDQILWPDHCIQGTAGADFHPALQTDRFDMIVRKGFHREIDSYSAFQENDRRTETGLAGYLRERRVRRVLLAGLAGDFCVFYSAMDALSAGFGAVVITDGVRSIDQDGSAEKTLATMSAAGIVQIESAALLE